MNLAVVLPMQTVPYGHLMKQLGLSEVRTLEDFLITDCFYPRVVQGKLDQKAGALVVEDAIGRDVQPDRLPDVTAGLAHWYLLVLSRAAPAVTAACFGVDLV